MEAGPGPPGRSPHLKTLQCRAWPAVLCEGFRPEEKDEAGPRAFAKAGRPARVTSLLCALSSGPAAVNSDSSSLQAGEVKPPEARTAAGRPTDPQPLGVRSSPLHKPPGDPGNLTLPERERYPGAGLALPEAQEALPK